MLSSRLSKRSFIVILLIPLSVIIDFANGILIAINFNFPLGILYRALVFIFFIFSFLSGKNKTSQTGLYFILVFTVWALLLLFWSMTSNNFSIAEELSYFLKATFLIVIYFLLRKYVKTGSKQIIIRVLHFYGYFVSICIIVSFLTGVGLDTYGDYAFGTASFFNASNDIGLSLLAIFTFCLISKTSNKVGIFFLIYIALILIGTTSTVFGGSLVVVVYILNYFFVEKLTKRNIFLKALISIFGFTLLFNFSLVVLNEISTNSYYKDKYEKMINEGPRSSLINSSVEYINKREWYEDLLGEGRLEFGINVKPYFEGKKGKRGGAVYVENDVIDFFGPFGLILSFIFFLFYFKLLRTAMWKYIICRDKYTFGLLFAILLLTFHGIIAGHVFLSPTTETIMATLFFLIQNFKPHET